MCTARCIIFGFKNLRKEEAEGRRILEIGSLDVNGSLRSLVESMHPAEYIGVDVKKGPGVDVICPAEDIIDKFGKESFDVVLSTELIEHVFDWKKVISNIKNICRPGGVILVTTRSYGFPYHEFPYDLWRYELNDFEHIFSDYGVEKLESDDCEPGVHLKAIKPGNFHEKDLTGYKLYSMVLNKRVGAIDDKVFSDFKKRSAKIDSLKAIGSKFISGLRRIKR
ncbi:MAG: methyltransferase domain-containing protein [Candidatus Omnitrophota bacterium]